MLIYSDPVFMEHDTGNHPENARRLIPLTRLLERLVDQRGWTRPRWTAASEQLLRLVHDAEHIAEVRGTAAAGGGWMDADTIVSRRSFDVACHAAGAVCDAVSRVVGGEDRRAFCAVRPPGHHALRSAAMGFCLLNNVAIGAALAVGKLGLNRVLVVDWDVHHGNGTQAIFWTEPRVAFLSMHRFPFYPGTGAADERGEGEGQGWTVNLPITFGTAPAEQLQRFGEALAALAERAKPELIMISAGFDSHGEDPIGSLQWASEDFAELTRMVTAQADRHAGGRVVSVLEGGYNPQALAASIELHLDALEAGYQEGD